VSLVTQSDSPVLARRAAAATAVRAAALPRCGSGCRGAPGRSQGQTSWQCREKL